MGTVRKMTTEVIPQKTEELKEGFSYASRPKPLQARRKYRNDPPGEQGYGNLMFDRRIVRGNTYAQTMLPINAQENPIDLQRKAEKKRARDARKDKAKWKPDQNLPLPWTGDVTNRFR